MHCRDIAEKAWQEGLLPSKIQRSDKLGWQLSHRARQEIKKRGDSARFTNPSPGYIGLAEWKRKASPARSERVPRGVVYVLSNPAMEGLLKIGSTKDGESLEKRMAALYNTSVPVPFRCEYAIRVGNATELEKRLHRVLGGRVNPRREFHRLDIEDVISVLQGCGEDVTPAPGSPDSHGEGVSRSEVQSGRRILQRRPLLRFSDLGIRLGATLTASRRGSDEKCTVVRDNDVMFRGKEMTWTNATKRLLGNPKWQPQPARHWRHKGRLLVEIYNEKYSPA